MPGVSPRAVVGQIRAAARILCRGKTAATAYNARSIKRVRVRAVRVRARVCVHACALCRTQRSRIAGTFWVSSAKGGAWRLVATVDANAAEGPGAPRPPCAMPAQRVVYVACQ